MAADPPAHVMVRRSPAKGSPGAPHHLPSAPYFCLSRAFQGSVRPGQGRFGWGRWKVHAKRVPGGSSEPASRTYVGRAGTGRPPVLPDRTEAGGIPHECRRPTCPRDVTTAENEESMARTKNNQ